MTPSVDKGEKEINGPRQMAQLNLCLEPGSGRKVLRTDSPNLCRRLANGHLGPPRKKRKNRSELPGLSMGRQKSQHSIIHQEKCDMAPFRQKGIGKAKHSGIGGPLRTAEKQNQNTPGCDLCHAPCRTGWGSPAPSLLPREDFDARLSNRRARPPIRPRVANIDSGKVSATPSNCFPAIREPSQRRI